ncbi:unnamed protein product [Didymodactylos carnosus]|uniref:Uncharacterized protein n=1 Tax=Didymodactylos carnosus TaxID=1234261 RepID=A0A814T479_9BILA|nr:unnamed protein product [Didymodactylos carnosus]CAF3919866.1 unnamed protein product [Didymodactylos carnosus]
MASSQKTYGNFDLSTTDLFNDLDSYVDNDDDDTAKQDYDLDTLHAREREETEDQSDTMSEDDNTEYMDTANQVLIGTMTTSRTSNRTKSIEEEHAVSQQGRTGL